MAQYTTKRKYTKKTTKKPKAKKILKEEIVDNSLIKSTSTLWEKIILWFKSLIN